MADHNRKFRAGFGAGDFRVGQTRNPAGVISKHGFWMSRDVMVAEAG
jgi:hypothetical protein